jgi:hypothetical protein
VGYPDVGEVKQARNITAPLRSVREADWSALHVARAQREAAP